METTRTGTRGVSAVSSLRLTRAALSVTVVCGALMWGLATGCLALAAAALATQQSAAAEPVARIAYPVAVLLAAAVAAARMWRGRGALELPLVALFVEGLQPELRYALVSLVERDRGDKGDGGELWRLDLAVAAVPWKRAVYLAIAKSLGRGALALAIGVALVRAVPAASLARVGRAGASGSPAALPASSASALSPLRARVIPPAYTGMRPFRLDEPTAIAAISGSAVILEGGRGSASAGTVTATLRGDTLPVTTVTGRWTVRLVLSDTPAVLLLAHGRDRRLVTLEPWPDSLPEVTLRSPARDSVLQATTGRITLSASAHDDFGLAALWFEYIVSAGEGESYRFRTGSIARDSLASARTARLDTLLELGSLRLEPGDLLHLRAVATDARTVRGPGRGVSETRTFRVARPGEYDSIAFDGLAPAEADTSVLSQRMLIMLAEALERRRHRLPRETVVNTSREIARDQARLRRRVSDVIFQRLGESEGEHAHDAAGAEADDDPRYRSPEDVLRAAEAAASVDPSRPLDFGHDETPLVAVNRPLLEAYNAMWEAGRWLEIGEPDDALPHMRIALAAIQRARLAERLYLRGRAPALVVDLRAVRLAGDRSSAAGGARTPVPPPPGTRENLARRLGTLLGSVAALGPAAFADSLRLMRLEALGRYPAAAAALREAVDAITRGADATAALVRVRRELGAAARSGSGAWEGW